MYYAMLCISFTVEIRRKHNEKEVVSILALYEKTAFTSCDICSDSSYTRSIRIVNVETLNLIIINLFM